MTVYEKTRVAQNKEARLRRMLPFDQLDPEKMRSWVAGLQRWLLANPIDHDDPFKKWRALKGKA